MGRLLLASFLLFALFFSPSLGTATSQPPPSKDAQALLVIEQALAASGWVEGVTQFQDLEASGSITYYWAGEEVSGPVAIKGKGIEQFRLDATLPDGQRSFAVSNGIGERIDADGSKTALAFQNTANAGLLNFPLPALAAARRDASATLTYVDSVVLPGGSAHQIRVRRNFTNALKDDPVLRNVRTTDYFIDAATLLVVKTMDTQHADDNIFEDYAREIHLSDYRNVQGLQVPFTIAEDFAGQRTWKIQLNSTRFNAGLTDSDFHF